MSTTDPRQVINAAAMTRFQILIVAITVGLNALDGFDVMSISFAAPGISDEWGISRAQLGFVLSMELIGMALGSIILGNVADKFGRRPTILGCLVAMTIGMFMVTTTNSVVELSLWRVLTGLGIGGMLASITAMAAEFSNNKRRHMSISIMAIGYPIGGVLGGSIAAWLLGYYDWRSVFYFGTIVTFFFIPVVYFWMPESVFWLARKQPEGALEKINRTMARLGHAVQAVLPTVTEESKAQSGGAIFNRTLLHITIVMTSAYFLHITTFYFILKWVPKLVVDMGFSPSAAGGVLVWASVGGAVGGGLFGILTNKFELKKLTIGAMLLGAIFTALFGRTPADLATMSMLVAAAGVFTNGAIVGMYALLAQVYPTHARASGTGFAVGFGRGGSVLSPIFAGFLLQFEIGLPTVAMVMSCGSLLAAITLCFLRVSNGDHVVAQTEKERDAAAASNVIEAAPRE
jgi:benzoate transport